MFTNVFYFCHVFYVFNAFYFYLNVFYIYGICVAVYCSCETA